MPLISICIPVFNRVDYLAITLDSIIGQISDVSLVEIVISDNASTDGTAGIIDSYSSKYSFVRGFSFEENKGADLNYLNVVDMAVGDYCWLFGSDDIMEPGALDCVLSKISTSDPDIVLCSEYIGDLSAKHLFVHHLLSIDTDRDFSFRNADDMRTYFSLAQSQSSLFGYLTSIIVRRDRWNEVSMDPSYIGTLYSHMYVLYSIIKNGATLSYIHLPLVTWRGGNDSFGGKGKITERYLVDINGFQKIANEFISDGSTLEEFKGVFRRHHPAMNICYLRLNTPTLSKWVPISRVLREYYSYSPVLLAALGFRFAPLVLHVGFFVHRAVNWVLRKCR